VYLDYFIPLLYSEHEHIFCTDVNRFWIYSVPSSSGGTGIFSVYSCFDLYLSLYLLVEDDSNLGGGNARFVYVNYRFRVGRTNLNYYRQPEFT
jgi:hypothetical protein